MEVGVGVDPLPGLRAPKLCSEGLPDRRAPSTAVLSPLVADTAPQLLSNGLWSLFCASGSVGSCLTPHTAVCLKPMLSAQAKTNRVPLRGGPGIGVGSFVLYSARK